MLARHPRTTPGNLALPLQFPLKFRHPLVIILLVASALSAFTGDAASFFIILAMVLLSVTLGFVRPPAFFFLILAAMVLVNLLALEGMKHWFFRRYTAV